MDTIFTDLRKVEHTLQQFTFIAEEINEGIVLTDLNGVISYINTPMARMHGYSSTDELAGKNISVFHTEDQIKTDVFAMMEEAKRRGRLSGPVEHLRSDGTLFPTQTKMSLLKNEADEAVGMAVFVTDTAERKKWEESFNNRITELQEDNEKLKKEICEHRDFEASLITQSSEIIAAKEILQQENAECQNTIEQLKRQLEEKNVYIEQLTERLSGQIDEYKRFEELARESRDKLQQQIDEGTKELAFVDQQSQFSDSQTEQPESV